MNGTEWTEPGQGAPVGDLLDAMQRDHAVLCAGNRTMGGVVGRARERQIYYDLETRTNLRLTGEPLTAEDVARIAVAK